MGKKTMYDVTATGKRQPVDCLNSVGGCVGEDAGPQIHFRHLQTAYEVSFPPFLVDFSDEYASEWNEESVYGRMDPISVYQRTSRVISITWKVLSANRIEAVDNMEKISMLIGFHYPSYFGKKNAGKMQTAPILKLKFPPLVVDAKSGGGLMGYTKGVAFKPNLDAGFIFVDNKMLPKEVTLSCNFTVLHTHQLGFSANSQKDGGFQFEEKFPYDLPEAPEGCGRTPSDDQAATTPPPPAPLTQGHPAAGDLPMSNVTAGAANRLAIQAATTTTPELESEGINLLVVGPAIIRVIKQPPQDRPDGDEFGYFGRHF